MRDEQTVEERTRRRSPKVSLRQIDDQQAGREIVDYVAGQPGTGEWQIAQALRVPLRQVYELTRDLEKVGALTR